MSWLTEEDTGGTRPHSGPPDSGRSWPHDSGPADTTSAGPWHTPQPPQRPQRGRRHSLGVLAVLLAIAAIALGIGFFSGASDDGASRPTASPAPSAQPSIEATPSPSTQSESPPQSPVAGSALAALQTLPVKGRAPKTGYDRDAWAVWSDYDGNGCDERQDTLARDLTEVQRVGCQVVGGRLVDPYTGTSIVVPTADPQIDIDHVVSLSDAWQKGAAGWSGAQLQRFASDPLNLLAVSSSANRSKSDGDAATWLPANTAYRCEMVARQIAVKSAYGLWVTAAERDAMAGVLSSCPGQELPQRGVAPTPVKPSGAAPTQPPAGAGVAPGLDPRFPSCAALKAAGFKGGYVKGLDPEYEWYRDADGDGVVCE